MHYTRVSDMLVAGLLLTAGVGIYLSSQSISAVSFDPLGSAAVPKLLSVVLIVLSGIQLLVVGKGIIQKTNSNEEIKEETKENCSRKTSLYFIAFVWVAIGAYVWVLSQRALPYSVVTLFFCAASVYFLTGNKRSLIKGSIVGLVAGLTIELIFTKVFFIDLPSFW